MSQNADNWMKKWRALSDPYTVPLELLLTVPSAVFVAERLAAPQIDMVRLAYKRGDDHGHSALGMTWWADDPEAEPEEEAFVVWRRQKGKTVFYDCETLEEARAQLRELAKVEGWL